MAGDGPDVDLGHIQLPGETDISEWSEIIIKYLVIIRNLTIKDLKRYLYLDNKITAKK